MLTWLSVVLGALSLTASYQGFAPLVDTLRGGGVRGQSSRKWLLAVVALLTLLAVVLGLRGAAKRRTQHFGPSSILPALTGWGGRIGIARFKGRCSCGGRLRFYDKPIEWVENLETGKRLRVTKREVVAECARDPQHHVWRVRAVDGSGDDMN
jgi:hypothetical protein